MWQLPQHLLALVLLTLLHRRVRLRSTNGGRRIYFCFATQGGISLGSYVFVNRDADELLVRHELGHCRQSLLLGPLYLLLIGLPSFIWAGVFPLIARLRPATDYYGFFTERWANGIAGLVPGQARGDGLRDR
ncbi:MAG TPA: hypothetical protein VMW69_00735 [Spirochaetia bacterium]|nr:hypothetical protein [Spirochaetia bacterium]